ncbi:MAG TPA: Ku protein, partial [Thermoanaerobaculia bacterium]|nr:Ku protein [Thermoanaerobaculia bacterium]
VEEKEPEGGGEVIDIMEALRRSLEGGRRAPKRAPAKRAGTTKSTTAAKSRARTTTKKRKAS